MARHLIELEQQARAAGERFLETHAETVEIYRREIARGIVTAGEQLEADVNEITAGNALCTSVMMQLRAYVEWLQWSLWDLPYFAVPAGVEPELFQKRVAGCGYVYLAGRVLDDALDRHFTYKSRRATFFSNAVERMPNAEAADGLAMLSGLLLCAEGLRRLAAAGPEMSLVLEKVLHSFRRAVIGAMMEHTPPEQWTGEFYERLIVLKNVDFWRCLYSAVDPERASPLYPFLERYYAFAQKLNDVVDFPEDLRRGQPNLLSLHLRGRNGNGNGASRAAVPAEVEKQLAMEIEDLARRAEEMPEPERGVAMLKLGETLRNAFEIGLFAPKPEPVIPPKVASVPPPFGWYATMAEAIGYWGAGALEDPACEVCGSRDRKRMMEFRGFTFHTCIGCTHVYVAPRIRPDLLLEMAAHFDDEDAEDNEFLEIQKVFAEPTCHLIRLRSPNNRLLDLGFGYGHVMRLARAYGFEAYGMDCSRRFVEELRPEFGMRVSLGTIGVDAIPWDAFGAVVMSHIVEHLTDPARVLRDVRSKMQPGGVLYVAVPDIGSVQFKLFGKEWDAVNPMVHMQYFNEASLWRLLESSGFVNLEKIKFPPLPRPMKPKWMQLMRDLGGTESGELAIVAHRPIEDSDAA